MKCPVCNGTGGEYISVLWSGIGGGPYDECVYCHGNGKVSWFNWLKYKLVIMKGRKEVDKC